MLRGFLNQGQLKTIWQDVAIILEANKEVW